MYNDYIKTISKIHDPLQEKGEHVTLLFVQLPWNFDSIPKLQKEIKSTQWNKLEGLVQNCKTPSIANFNAANFKIAWKCMTFAGTKTLQQQLYINEYILGFLYSHQNKWNTTFKCLMFLILETRWHTWLEAWIGFIRHDKTSECRYCSHRLWWLQIRF